MDHLALTEYGLVCHRPDGLEDVRQHADNQLVVCHRPDGLEDQVVMQLHIQNVCHRPDGLEEDNF